MAELDRLKEEIGHLKLWEGMAAAIFTGLTGWLFAAPDSGAPMTFVLAIAGVISVGIGTLRIYRKIAQLIARIGPLKPWRR